MTKKIKTRLEKCEDCGGTGVWMDQCGEGGIDRWYVQRRCKRCDGTGKVEVEIKTYLAIYCTAEDLPAVIRPMTAKEIYEKFKSFPQGSLLSMAGW